MARRTAALVVALLVSAGALTACSGDDGDGGGGGPAAQQGSGTPSASATPSTSSPEPTPTPPAAAVAGLAAKGASADFTAAYLLDSTDPRTPDAKVRIHRRGPSYRVDVLRGGAESRLLTTRTGIVSCQLQGRRQVCLLVARPGQALPRLFDAGVQRLVTSDLQAIAAGKGLEVVAAGILPAEGDLPAARCYQVSGAPRVDAGEYCLTADGVLRQAQFPSGTLSMTALTGAPPASAFRPPVRPTPLPR